MIITDSSDFVRIQNKLLFLFDKPDCALNALQPSPYTWAQLRGSNFASNAFKLPL